MGYVSQKRNLGDLLLLRADGEPGALLFDLRVQHRDLAQLVVDDETLPLDQLPAVQDHLDGTGIQWLVEEENIPIRNAEQKIFDIDHTIIGSWLAKKWNLPNIFIEIIKNHHRPSQNLQYFFENAICCLADNLCKDMKIGHSGDYITTPPPSNLLKMIKIDINQVAQVCLKLNKEKEEIKKLIGAIE